MDSMDGNRNRDTGDTGDLLLLLLPFSTYSQPYSTDLYYNIERVTISFVCLLYIEICQS
jgi:hypothetical protein